ATGMMAQEMNVNVISNNIANLRTTGFKRQRAEFLDLLYQNVRRAGTQTSEQNTMVPTGVQIGTGVRVGATTRILTQGTTTQTDNDYNIAIRGEGYFRIQLPDGRTGYTRDGSFQLDAEGRLVTKEGYLIDPNITIPRTAQSVTISSAGAVQVTVTGQTQIQ